MIGLSAFLNSTMLPFTHHMLDALLRQKFSNTHANMVTIGLMNDCVNGPIKQWSCQPIVQLSCKHIYIIIELEWLVFRVEMFKMHEALIKIAINFDIITRLLNLKQVFFSCLSSRTCFYSLIPSIYFSIRAISIYQDSQWDHS